MVASKLGQNLGEKSLCPCTTAFGKTFLADRTPAYMKVDKNGKPKINPKTSKPYTKEEINKGKNIMSPAEYNKWFKEKFGKPAKDYKHKYDTKRINRPT